MSQRKHVKYVFFIYLLSPFLKIQISITLHFPIKMVIQSLIIYISENIPVFVRVKHNQSSDNASDNANSFFDQPGHKLILCFTLAFDLAAAAKLAILVSLYKQLLHQCNGYQAIDSLKYKC